MDAIWASPPCPSQVAMNLLELRKRYGGVLAVEECKDRLIQDLFFEVETLQFVLHNECAKFEHRAHFLNRELDAYKSEIGDLKHNQAKLSYVSILVDGDCMNFNDAFIKEGHDGGRKAALLLRQSVERYIRDIDAQASPSLQYKVCVYANTPGLEKAYREAKVLRSNETLDPFIRGFNMESSQCDFIDAGNGKECSDVKIRATFERDILDVHCHHIIFCAATDNGYARILGSHRGSKRITLVEGAPFAWEIEQLSSEFRTTSFPAVFRSLKLPARASSFSAVATASANISMTARSSSTSTPPSSPPRDYATIAKANLPLPSSTSLITSSSSSSSSTPSSSSPTTSQTPSPTSSSSSSSLSSTASPPTLIFDISPTPKSPDKKLHYNARDQRIDPPLRRPSSKENYERLRTAKYCNQYHLQDDCPFGDGCNYRHGRRLRAQNLHDLRCISRTSVCAEGLWCANRKCVCGHQCPFEERDDHMLEECRFPEEMHGVDRVVTRVE
ncbi:CCCH zinc finger DNA binding protein [Aspergillus homomorphus CBS 101889]|uniref:C3H1-type domain-containing protein n=1 Tax=Aspergillus homomorphus (strain CBS 101889) TaxID=1450537 RepID=A0A395HXX5_ASPHC|nr:hypothetical protein BO97DRAFT_443001 [Aspergillus homomorphus CBS 101889]RAL12782.1 hypothetical protein BO97DRAFT_443001 [Aspergillus homomorphus CBS 101889]